MVREVFDLYTRGLWSIGAIARELNARGTATRFGKSPWERSTVWGMLRNPAYKGRACFGKTEPTERKKITRPLRQKGGFSARSSASRETSRDQWIEVPVPAIVSEETFEMAQQRLKENKSMSARKTKDPTLLQSLLVCGKCGYGLYLTSTKTTRRRLRYYRCLGSDKWRNLRGPPCDCRPIRQDYLDELVWTEILRLLHSPELVQAEIERRLRENLASDPVQQRKINVERELRRLDVQIDKLLDAYQEDLLGLADLRERSPKLRARKHALEKELESISIQALENSRLQEISASMEDFLAQLQRSAQTMCAAERQKVARLLIKEIVVDGDTVTIHHSIPILGDPKPAPNSESYLLCTRGDRAALRDAPFRLFRAPVFMPHSRPEVFSDQAQDGFIVHAPAQLAHQPVVVDRVEVGLQVAVHSPTIALRGSLADPLNGGLGAAAVTEAKAAFAEVHLKERTEHLSDGLLDHPVQNGRQDQRALRAVRLGYPDAFDRGGLVAALPDPIHDARQVCPRKRGKPGDGHAVHAGRSLVRAHAFPCRLQVVLVQNRFQQGRLWNSVLLGDGRVVIHAPPPVGSTSSVRAFVRRALPHPSPDGSPVGGYSRIARRLLCPLLTPRSVPPAALLRRMLRLHGWI